MCCCCLYHQVTVRSAANMLQTAAQGMSLNMDPQKPFRNEHCYCQHGTCPRQHRQTAHLSKRCKATAQNAAYPTLSIQTTPQGRHSSYEYTACEQYSPYSLPQGPLGAPHWSTRPAQRSTAIAVRHCARNSSTRTGSSDSSPQGCILCSSAINGRAI